MLRLGLLVSFAMLLALVSFPSIAASYPQALESCNASASQRSATGWHIDQPCADGAYTGPGGGRAVIYSGTNPNGVRGTYAFQYTGNMCDFVADINASMDMSTGGSAIACNGSCKYYLADGMSVSNGKGQSLASGTWKPTGGTCSAGEAPPIGGSNGEGPPTPKPSICTDGTCYNPETDGYCYKAGGASTCVSGATARGEGTGAGDTPGGGCASGGNATICAGKDPPKPPPPPDSPISDPTSEINSADRYTETHSTGTVGGGSGQSTNNTVQANVYGAGNSPTTSGQQPGDVGPAPASSSGAPPGDDDGKGKGSASGGGTCGSPPVCSGDAPTCAVVTQTWLARCGSTLGDANGNGQPDWTEIDKTKDDGYGVEETGLSSVFGEVTVDGSGLDTSGWVGNSCPALPQAGMLHLDEYQTFFCDWLALVRAIVLICAAFVSVRIMAGSAS